MKKYIISLLLILVVLITQATTYYVSSSGLDTNSGLTKLLPWKTFLHVNDRNFVAGDSILFKRGDTFYGTILPMNDSRGAAGNPVVFNSYGTGNNPIITGFTTITSGWTSEGGGIYSKAVTCESKPNIITINGIQYAMGRFPNASTTLTNYTTANYLNVDSHVSNTSITDSDLNSAITNWTGAKIVLRTNGYVLDRCTITNHSGSTLSYSNLGSNLEATNGYYYFIQDDLRTLDQFGEWYYNGTTLYVYFGSNSPTNYTVNVPSLNRLFDVASHYSSYITVKNLSLVGANVETMRFNTTPYAVVDNCTLNFSGGNGIYMISDHGIMTNCSLNHIAKVGLWLVIGSNYTVTNNTIKNTGLLEGSIDAGSYAIPIEVSGTGSGNNQNNDGLVQYNRIDSCAKVGIHFNGWRTLIKNNFVSNTHFTINDGGAINTGGNDITSQSGAIIEANICIGGFGKKPTAASGTDMAYAIYLDSYSNSITIKDNTIANYEGGVGIVLSNTDSVTIENNTSFNNMEAMNWTEWSAAKSLTNVWLSNNVFVAKSSNQYILSAYSRYNHLIPFGTSNNNYFTKPIDDNVIIKTYEAAYDPNAYQQKTLAQWRTYSSQDANTKTATQTITTESDFQFEYNATTTTKPVTLTRPMIDVRGQKYATSTILLQPYASIVLMTDSNPTVISNPTRKKTILKTGSKYYINPATGKMRVR